MKKLEVDLVIAGGGVAGSLLFDALLRLHPRIKAILIERSSVLAGDQTMTIREPEVPHNLKDWIFDLASANYPSHQYRFPQFVRELNEPLYILRSSELSKRLFSKYGSKILIHQEVLSEEKIDDRALVTLSSGLQIETETLILARGWGPLPEANSGGYQKFVGLDLEFDRPHQISIPIMMDAQVPQIDGARYLTILPLTETSLFVRDNYISKHAILKTERIEAEIKTFVEKHHGKILNIIRRESGIIPLGQLHPSTHPSAFPQIGAEALSINPLGGAALTGLFHQIESVTNTSSLSPRTIKKALSSSAKEHLKARHLDLFLHQLLQAEPDPSRRFLIYSSLYQLPTPLLERVLSGKTSYKDRLVILLKYFPTYLPQTLRNWKTLTS